MNFPYRIKYLPHGPAVPLFTKDICRIGRVGCFCWRLVGRFYLVKFEWRLL